MGKVYDALKRAEEQRGAARPPTAASSRSRAWEAAAEPPRAGFFRRWFRRRRGQPTPSLVSELSKRRIALLQPDSFVAEQFRTLRARIDAISTERPLRTVAITSSVPGEGKTTAAINLAYVTSMGVDRRVLLIDCDLRGAKVGRALGLSPELGLAEVLLGNATLKEAVVRVEGTQLDVLCVRTQPDNPSELLAAPAMRELLREAAEHYDTVVLDTPPTLSLPDAKTVSELVDGLVVVVRAGSTRRDDVEATLDVLDRRRLLGMVLNGADVETARYQYSG
ncbi:MAG: CpsD/CapB family tyrosine-protein kinase [Deltaproteobacteria bacterium]|nr:MAG: CpsD/CapB family tyrosine-protein kinase [Deltaproteobacteria bacterium]